MVPILPVVGSDEARAEGDLSAPPSPKERPPGVETTKAAPDFDHSLTHFPKLSTCEICARAKTQKAQCRRRSRERREEAAEAGEIQAEDLDKIDKFGELVTADHAIIGDEQEASRHGHRAALILLDTATKWMGCYPSATKSAADTLQALQNFVGPREKVEYFYTDNSGELAAAAKTLGWRHDTSTPNRPQTNGMAESAVRKVLEGTRAVLLQSGLPHRWWAEAAQCYCSLRNVCDVVVDGVTAYQRRQQQDFKGVRLPFGCAVQYKPSAAREVNNLENLVRGQRKGSSWDIISTLAGNGQVITSWSTSKPTATTNRPTMCLSTV